MNLTDSSKYIKVHNDTYKSSFSPQDLVSMFETIVGEISDIKLGKSITIETPEEEIQTAYSSYIIASNKPDYSNNDHYGNVGLVFSAPKNQIIVYSGFEAQACLNLCIFGANYVNHVFDVFDDRNIVHVQSALNTAVNNLPRQFDEFNRLYNLLSNRSYSAIEFQKRKGEIIEKMPIEMVAKYIVHSESCLREPTNIYAQMPKTDWTLFSTYTDRVKRMSLDRQIPDTLSLERLFV